MDIEMEEPTQPHETCAPADKEGVSWCAFHNQQLGFCQAEIAQGATEPTKHPTHFQRRLEELAQLPQGYRILVTLVDPLSNMSVQVLDPLDNGFSTWELMGIIEFLRTQVRLTASQQIVQSEMHGHTPRDEDEDPQRPM